MEPIIQYIIAAVLFVLGLAAIGGAVFGRQRPQRLLLAVVGIIFWAGTLFVYSRAISERAVLLPTPTVVVAAPTNTPTTAPPTDTPTPLPPPPTATATAAPPEETPTATPTPYADIPGRIVFHSNRSGNYDIWIMNANGSDPQRLTGAAQRDIEPAWSPDGQQIVFASGRDDPENTQLYIMNADGSDQRRLMEPMPFDQLAPRWSPDGQWIAFHGNQAIDANGFVWFDVFKVRSDGTELTNLTNAPGNSYMPDWSPDGSRIVFASQRDGNWELYVMNSDGSNQVRLTDNLADDMRPRWSPDGKTILFVSNRDGLANLYVMDAPALDVTGPIDQDVRLLTLPFVNDDSPAWAFGGDKILFGSDRDSVGTTNWEIYIINADGSTIFRLTNSPQVDRFPDWTP